MVNNRTYCGNGIYTTNRTLHWGVYITGKSGFYELWGFVGGGEEGSQLWVKFGSPKIGSTTFSDREGIYAVGTEVFLGRLQMDQAPNGTTFSAVCSGGSNGQNGTSQGKIGPADNGRPSCNVNFKTAGYRGPTPLITYIVPGRLNDRIPNQKPLKDNDFSENGFTISFNPGTGATVAYNQYIAKSILHYTFAQWKDSDGNLYSPSSYITNISTSYLELTAQWNQTSEQSGVPLPMAYKSGYKLKGWTKNSSGSGTLVEDGFIPEQDTNLYAVWEADPPKVKTKVNSTWTESSVKIKNGSEWVSTVGVSAL